MPATASSCRGDPDRYRDLSRRRSWRIFAFVHAAGRADQPRRGLPRRHGQHRGLRRTARPSGERSSSASSTKWASSSRVGVATNKLCAKVASDLRKPDALVVVPPGEEAAFLAPLPIRRLWGVGPQAQAALADYGVVTIGQLAATPPGTLHRRFGRHGDDLSARARGIDRGRVQVTHGAKSVGHEHTFDHDTADVRPTRGHPARSGRIGRQPPAPPRPRRRDRSSSSFATRASRRSPARRRCPARPGRPGSALRRDAGAAAPDAGRGARRPADRPHRHQPLRRPAAHPVRRAGAHRPTDELDRRRPRAVRRPRHHARAPAHASAPHRRFDFGERPDAPSSDDDDEA